jgi:hypothetical protein
LEELHDLMGGVGKVEKEKDIEEDDKEEWQKVTRLLYRQN